MTSPVTPDLLTNFARLIPPEWFAARLPARGPGSRRGIYSWAVVTWLMVVQRIHPKGTLHAALEHLFAEWPTPLLTPCKRVRERRISRHAGGYCQARQKMPTVIVNQVSDLILAKLQAALPDRSPHCSRPMYLLDGSSLELEHTADFVAAYPPARNQFGRSHWPILKIAVMHNLANGLALRPAWGPMYGPNAVSEQALAEALLERLPPESMVVGDRNFGVFSTAFAAHQRGHGVVLRLTESRFLRLSGAPGFCGQDLAITWSATRFDRRNHPHLPDGSRIEGRLLVAQLRLAKQNELIYLFTTLDLPAPPVLEIYGDRWNIETDLRSLKSTIHLQQLKSRSTAMMEKEFVMAVTAYNLVRAVMGWAAEHAGAAPRSLSFSQVQNVVDATLPTLVAAGTPEDYAVAFQHMIQRACAYCRLPNRSRQRSFPRLVWGRNHRTFPNRPPLPPQN